MDTFTVAMVSIVGTLLAAALISMYCDRRKKAKPIPWSDTMFGGVHFAIQHNQSGVWQIWDFDSDANARYTGLNVRMSQVELADLLKSLDKTYANSAATRFGFGK